MDIEDKIERRQKRSYALVPLEHQELSARAQNSGPTHGSARMVAEVGSLLETAENLPISLTHSGLDPISPENGRENVSDAAHASDVFIVTAVDPSVGRSPTPTEREGAPTENRTSGMTLTPYLEFNRTPNRSSARELLVTGVPEWLLQAMMGTPITATDTQTSEFGEGRAQPGDPEEARRLMPPPPPLNKRDRSESSNASVKPRKYLQIEDVEDETETHAARRNTEHEDAESELAPPTYRTDDEAATYEEAQAMPQQDTFMQAEDGNPPEEDGEYAQPNSNEAHDWGPWTCNVNGHLEFLDNELQRLEQSLLPEIREELLEKISKNEQQVVLQFEQFWERQQQINVEFVQENAQRTANIETALTEKVRITQIETERLLQSISHERENRLRAELQQGRSAQMEYLEKRVQELVATTAKTVAAEAIVTMSAGSGSQSAEYTRLLSELQESRAKELGTAIADLKKTVEAGDQVYVKRTEMTAIVKALYQQMDKDKEDAILQSAMASQKYFAQNSGTLKAPENVQMKMHMEALQKQIKEQTDI